MYALQVHYYVVGTGQGPRLQSLCTGTLLRTGSVRRVKGTSSPWTEGVIRPEWAPADGFGNRTAAGQGSLLNTFRGPRIVLLLQGSQGISKEGRENGFSSLTRPVKSRCQEVLVPARGVDVGDQCIMTRVRHVFARFPLLLTQHHNTCLYSRRRGEPGGYNIAKFISEICVAFSVSLLNSALWQVSTDCCTARAMYTCSIQRKRKEKIRRALFPREKGGRREESKYQVACNRGSRNQGLPASMLPTRYRNCIVSFSVLYAPALIRRANTYVSEAPPSLSKRDDNFQRPRVA